MRTIQKRGAMFKRWFKPHDRVTLDATVLTLTYGDAAADVAIKRSEKALGPNGETHWKLVAEAITRMQRVEIHAV
jgi:hypothetical protein